MIRKDYLLAQIEAIGRMYSKMIAKREDNSSDIFDFTDTLYEAFGVDITYIKGASVDDILSRIGNWELIEYFVMTLVEDDRLNSDADTLTKCYTLIATIQNLDRTYSLSRIALVGRIEARLNSLT